MKQTDEDYAYGHALRQELDSACDECDCSFPCWRGRERCIRLPLVDMQAPTGHDTMSNHSIKEEKHAY